MSNALYVYGVVKACFNPSWIDIGLENNKVHMISNGKFGAIVHNCIEKPYNPTNPEKIKELILVHNKVLDKAIKDFGSVIPMHFNTIIKNGKAPAENNLRTWLSEDEEKLERTWTKINGKEEYGLRVYYEKDKLIQEASRTKKLKEIKQEMKGKSEGISYLLQEVAKTNKNEIIQNRITDLKQKFCNEIKKITPDIKINASRISIKEDKDLLLSISILAGEEQMKQIKENLEQNISKYLSFQSVGPFAPYSFVEDETEH